MHIKLSVAKRPSKKLGVCGHFEPQCSQAGSGRKIISPHNTIEMGRMGFKLSTIVGEIFEIYTFKMTRIDFKLSTVVGENFEIYTVKMNRIDFKLSTMVGENFEIYTFKMTRINFKLSTIFG